ncbi:MAG: hypothetical protein JWN63_3803 [Candidatus Acidoferrum typicum]|nr:hypothetical protein [Candidatus Acidoferrum typicum]
MISNVRSGSDGHFSPFNSTNENDQWARNLSQRRPMVHYQGRPISDPVQGSRAFRKILRARDKRALAAETEMPASSAISSADLSFN